MFSVKERSQYKHPRVSFACLKICNQFIIYDGMLISFSACTCECFRVYEGKETSGESVGKSKYDDGSQVCTVRQRTPKNHDYRILLVLQCVKCPYCQGILWL